MAIYEYKGLNKAGGNVKGTIDADNLRAARARLKKNGIYISSIKDKTKTAKKKNSNGPSSSRGVGVQDLSLMTRQLATLLKANVPLVDSIQAVSEQVENTTLAECMSTVRNMVNEGAPFHKSIAKYPKIFNKIYISMCDAGEMSGTLDIILIRLAEFTESQSALNSKVKSAMLYPLIMFVFTAVLLVVLFIFVIPKMMVVFESSPELVLPWYTEAIIAVSAFLTNYWHVLIFSLLGSFFFFKHWKNSENGRKQWDYLILKIPVIGKLTRLIAVSRFTRTLSTLLVGGVPMLGAMSIVRNVVDNEVLAKAIDEARENISEGESIAGPLRKSGEFPPLVIHMIRIGEKTGELENMLTQVSDSYDFQVKNAVEGLTSLMEPLMIVVMGCVIGVIVFAIMIPMFEMSNLAG